MRIPGAKDLAKEVKRKMRDLIKQGKSLDAFCQLIVALNINIDIPNIHYNPNIVGAETNEQDAIISFDSKKRASTPDFVYHEWYHLILKQDHDTDYWAEIFVHDLLDDIED